MYLVNLSSNTMIIDPRYPECREFMIDIYEKLLNDYDIEGFKFDFIDSFRLNEKSFYNSKMNTKSFEIALDNLFTKAKEKLNKIKNNILIEFRQNHTCPNLLKNAILFLKLLKIKRTMLKLHG